MQWSLFKLIDSGNQENITSKNVVLKQQLVLEVYNNPYTIGWIKYVEKV